ncbi:MAG: hypothetical protein ACJLTB_01245, partial [Algoriphagus aquaeductus]
MQIGVTEIKPTLKASTFASRTSPSTDQSLQKSLLFQPKEKLILKNFPTLQKNKKRHAQPDTDRQQNKLTMTRKNQVDSDFQTRWTRTPAANSGFASCGVKCLNSSSVFQINFSARLTVWCSEIPHERKA